jgi:membrane protease YdiL (CAAX protease family)
LAFGTALQLFILAILAATRSVHFSLAGEYNPHFWRLVGANVLLFAVAGAVEELVFRGYALKWAMMSVGAPAAIAISGILFGVAHGLNPGATFFSTLNTALAGILLALPYVRTRSMWMQIGVHWSWNVALCTIVSLPVSGINFGPHLFTTTDTGPAWLTGGNYGPEGGAVVTIACVAGIAWLISTRRLKPSPSTQKDLQ